MKIAVAGKGGVGKTFIAGTLACCFSSAGLKTIAIDADTSPNLALTLGMTPQEASLIIPVAENENLIEEKTKTDYPGVFRLSYTVDDIVAQQSVGTPCGVSLLVMGTIRTMGGGCACPAHNLIRALLSHLVVERDEVVILDMEAGVEHLGRGTARNVDILLIITDAHQASLVTAGRIADLAGPAGISRVVYVANRVNGKDSADRIIQAADEHGVSVLALIPFDEQVLISGVRGISPAQDHHLTAVQAVRRLGDELMAMRKTE